MALLDLSYVTTTFLNLLRDAFATSPAWPNMVPINVLPEPPSRLVATGLGFYLYHVRENEAFKNMPPPGRNTPAIRYAPLALNLYFQLSANSTGSEEIQAALDEKRMMGIAMKALHDYPEVTEDTILAINPVMPEMIRGAGNAFRISLQPIPPNESVHYWTAGTTPQKLSAYYEVTVALFEPEATTSRSGRVLSYGVHTFTQGAPQLISSFNTITYTPPNSPVPLQVTARPAQAPPNNGSNSVITLEGTGLSGDTTELLLLGRWPSWNNESVVADWITEVRESQVTAEAADTVLLGGVPRNILPGIYGAQLRVTRSRLMPDGENRQFPHLSNQCPITISPRVGGIAGPAPGNIFTVTGSRFQEPLEANFEELVQVYLGQDALTLWDGVTLDPGQFDIMSPTQLRFRLPLGLVVGSFVPVRIFVNGAEAPPNWIEIP